MRVTHVVCTSSFAGVERHVAVLAAAQHDLGYEVTVLGGDPDRMGGAIDRPGVLVRPSPDLPSTLRHLAGPPGRRADVVATHMTTADVAALVSPALVGTPIVSTRHFAAPRGRTPSVRRLGRRMQQRLAAEIAVSEYVARSVDGDSTVILPGIADRPDGLTAAARDKTVLLAQRLESEKDTPVALHAFARSGLADRGWRLQVAGEGSQRAALEELAAGLSILTATDFLGHRQDVPDLMARAGIFLATTSIEGMGLSVLEAMASGLPVVASAAGGHLESVGPTPGARLFPPGDGEAAAAQLQALADAPALRDAYGAALRERQRTVFSVTGQALATDALYRHVVAARSPEPRPRAAGGTDLVVISLEPWDEVWRRNQHLVAGLLRDDPDLRVLFVEPARDPLHSLRIGGRPERGRGLRRGPHLPGIGPDALWLLEPTKHLPRRLDPGQDDRWAGEVLAAAQRLGFREPRLWVNDPLGALVMQRSGWPTLYDITDDWLEADRDPATLRRLAAHEASLMDDAAEVVVCSPGLVTTKSGSREVTLVRNGVDVDRATRPTARPDDLPAGPVALYLGTLHADRLDVALCTETARALAGTGTLVLVGPDALTPDERERLDGAGVLRLGAKGHRSVPAYLQHADVLVVPHVVDEFTDSLDPIKLYEYRAVGRPVVSTPVAGFRGDGGSRVQIVDRPGFAAAVRAALPAADHFPHRADPSVPSWADRVAEMRSVLRRVERETPTPGVGVIDVPITVRVRFGHAAVQRIADAHSLDVLHIKGDALDDSLIHPRRVATDADVLVRPDHVDRLITVLTDAGYRSTGSFASGSPFEHSMTMWHTQWGYLDVHRHYPGVGLPPAEAFDVLWRDRTHKRIAGTECPVPALPAQVGILVMHAGRSVPGGQPGVDVAHSWQHAPPGRQAATRAWVAEVRGEVAFAAGIGELHTLPPSTERDLWQAVTREGRLQEWRARIAAAPDLRTRAVLVLRAPLVNTDHLTKELGHAPSRTEIIRAFLLRSRRAIQELRHRRRSR